MSSETMITAGFADPVLQSQAAFRAVLAALSEPGTIRHVADDIAPPEGLCTAAATLLLTLADYETPVWLPEALRNGPAGAWLRFHCGAPLVERPEQAAFAVIDGAAADPALAAFNVGTDQFPDRSTTVIVQIAALDEGATLVLSGPGIASTRTIAPQGLQAGFIPELAANNALYPLGVDVVLACGDALIGLPRTTQAQEARLMPDRESN